MFASFNFWSQCFFNWIPRWYFSIDFSIEKSIEKYQRGIQLKKHCDQKLKEANMKIDQIEIDKNGNVTEKPFVRKKK
mgnify:CR=1 FL=1